MKRMRRFWITAVLTLILALTISAGAEAAPDRQSDSLFREVLARLIFLSLHPHISAYPYSNHTPHYHGHTTHSLDRKSVV